MAIKLTCPSCLREAKLVNSFWGKDYKCKGCGETFRISREVVDGFAHSKKEPPAMYAKCPGCVQAVLVIDGACPLCQTSIDSKAKHIRLTSDSSPAFDVSRPIPRGATPAGPPQQQVMEHTRPLIIEEVPDAPAIPGMSNRNLIIIGCALVFLIIGTTVVMTVFNSRRKAEMQQAELLPMEQDLDQRIAQSEHLSAEFEYDEALGFLTPIEDRVISNMNDELVDKYWVAVGKVRKAKVDYEIKIDKGYVVFDGKLVTKSEQEQMVARKEEERRKAEARRKAIEVRRRAEEERRQQEEARRRELARQAEARRQEQSAGFKIVEIDYKLTSSSGSYVHVGWKVRLKSFVSDPRQYTATIKFLDKDGFVVNEDMEFGLYLPANATRDFTYRTMMSRDDFIRIDNCKVHVGAR